MVRERFENLDPDKQQQLYEAAADEFSENGFEGASLNRIIDRAGMSKGSLYYYFNDKSDLYSSLMERATTMLVKLVGGFALEDLTAENFWPSFEGTVRRSVGYLQRNEWFVRLSRSFYRMRGGRSHKATKRFFDWIGGWTGKVLARGQELGVVRTDLPMEFLVELTLAVGETGDRWILEHWTEMSSAERESTVVAELDAFHRLLEPRP